MSQEEPIDQPAVDAAPIEQKPAVAPTGGEHVPAAPVRNEPQAPDPRRRLRELLAIPDHQRTDAIWDEIIELEICLAPGNRIQGAQSEPGRRQQGPGQNQGRRPEQPRRQDAVPGSKPAKRFFKKAKRPPGAPPKA